MRQRFEAKPKAAHVEANVAEPEGLVGLRGEGVEDLTASDRRVEFDPWAKQGFILAPGDPLRPTSVYANGSSTPVIKGLEYPIASLVRSVLNGENRDQGLRALVGSLIEREGNLNHEETLALFEAVDFASKHGTKGRIVHPASLEGQLRFFAGNAEYYRVDSEMQNPCANPDEEGSAFAPLVESGTILIRRDSEAGAEWIFPDDSLVPESQLPGLQATPVLRGAITPMTAAELFPYGFDLSEEETLVRLVKHFGVESIQHALMAESRDEEV